MFRLLKADEIECRVSTINEKGLTLLLYKDARVDQNILDETVGPERWQRTHTVINDNLFCSVGIRFDSDNQHEWVWKQDVGVESNTEKEKGQASDAFKRACFNWGIGRELYTAPFIWIPAGEYKATTGRNGKPSTYDRFDVVSIGYADGAISELEILNESTHKVVYRYPRQRGQQEPAEEPKKPEEKANSLQKSATESADMSALIDEKEQMRIEAICNQRHWDPARIFTDANKNSIWPRISKAMYGAFMRKIGERDENERRA